METLDEHCCLVARSGRHFCYNITIGSPSLNFRNTDLELPFVMRIFQSSRQYGHYLLHSAPTCDSIKFIIVSGSLTKRPLRFRGYTRTLPPLRRLAAYPLVQPHFPLSTDSSALRNGARDTGTPLLPYSLYVTTITQVWVVA